MRQRGNNDGHISYLPRLYANVMVKTLDVGLEEAQVGGRHVELGSLLTNVLALFLKPSFLVISSGSCSKECIVGFKTHYSCSDLGLKISSGKREM